MTSAARLTLTCDHPGCAAETAGPRDVASHAELRRIRRRDGWTSRVAAGRVRDYCPNHPNPRGTR